MVLHISDALLLAYYKHGEEARIPWISWLKMAIIWVECRLVACLTRSKLAVAGDAWRYQWLC